MSSFYRTTGLLLLSALLASCTSGEGLERSPTGERQLLNSERIEQRFGSFGIRLLRSPANLRVASLFSGEGAQRVTRTFAVTRLQEIVDGSALAPADREIRAGSSIGITLKRHGWTVDKHHRLTDQLQLLPDVHQRVARLMGLKRRQPLAVHVYDLMAARDGQRLHYARIAEVHHPAYLTLPLLQRIYGAHGATDAAAREALLGWAQPALRQREIN